MSMNAMVYLAGTAERYARAALSMIAEPNDASMADLLAGFTAEDILGALTGDGPNNLGQMLAKVGHTEESAGAAERRWAPRVKTLDFIATLELAAAQNIALVIPGEPEWPTRMDDLDVPPIALWVRGRVELLTRRRSVAMVGARAATGYGEHVAMELASGAVAEGVTVVSGGAYGIDGAAHRAALVAEGETVAYMAGGVDRLYPSGHQMMLERVAQYGAVVSEVAPGSAPTRWRFLARNRLIAAAAAATVVVEAGNRSGALKTAEDAKSLRRPVGAVPGPITSPASSGCHRLIREGAACITSTRDVLDLANLTRPDSQENP